MTPAPPPAMVRLTTARLVLEPTEASHAPGLALALSDPALFEHTGEPVPTLEEWHDRLARWAPRLSPDVDALWWNWVVALGDGTTVGWIQATLDPRPGTGSGVAVLAWAIGTPWQGRGYATEAVRAVLDHLQAAGWTRFVAMIAPGNDASRRLALGLGLRPDGSSLDGEDSFVLDLARPLPTA